MTSFTIGTPGSDHIIIDVVKCDRTKTKDHDDYSWLPGTVVISVGNFSGSYDFMPRIEEIEMFKNEISTLYQKLNGIATFETLEDQIKLTLSGNGRGCIFVSGIATDSPGRGNRLHFTFDIDQTYLPNLINELDSIIS